jgi:hypothetical protein
MKYIAHTSSPLSPQTPYSSLSTLTLVLSHFNFWNLVLVFPRRPRTSAPASLSLILTLYGAHYVYTITLH